MVHSFHEAGKYGLLLIFTTNTIAQALCKTGVLETYTLVIKRYNIDHLTLLIVSTHLSSKNTQMDSKLSGLYIVYLAPQNHCR